MDLNQLPLESLFKLIGGQKPQGGTVLGNGYTDSIQYIDPFLANPEYDKNNPYGIDQETERVEIINGKPVVIGEDAPRGVDRVIKGILDKIDPSKDRDQRGSGADKWGDLPDEGYGREAILVDPGIPNPEYPGNPNLPGAGPVPQISRIGQAEQILQQEYQTRRANANSLYMMDQLFPRLANAQYYGYQLDQAQLANYIASPLGASRLRSEAAEQAAMPRMARAALIEARAKSQEAANEFGQLGTQRTYFTG